MKQNPDRLKAGQTNMRNCWSYSKESREHRTSNNRQEC